MKFKKFSFVGLVTALLMVIGVYLINQGVAGKSMNYFYIILGLIIIITRIIWQYYLLNYLEDRNLKWHRDNMLLFGATNFLSGIIIMDKVFNSQQWIEINWSFVIPLEVRTLFLALGLIVGLFFVYVGLRCALIGTSDYWYDRYLNSPYP